jgi:glycosyltransferase involved in cell wall biosynthesis
MKPPIVHTHTSKAGVLGRLAAWLTRVPIIIHTPHGHVFYGHFSSFFSKVYLLVERVLDRITDHLIALTHGEAKDYIDLRVSQPRKISIIPSGVDLRRFLKKPADGEARRKKLGLPLNVTVVGFVGWLWPIKGVNYLVEAMGKVVQQAPTTLLALVGKGGEESSLKNQVKALNLGDNVVFLGWRPDIEEIMPSFDLLVLPSLNEGMGRVLVEAMAAGLPIVASRVGGIPDLVKDGKNGLLVPPADPTALAEAISKLLNNKEKRERLGAAGRKMCGQFSLEAMVEQIGALYQKLLARSF